MTQLIVRQESEVQGRETKRREIILEVLSRAADDRSFMTQLSENTHEALTEYYILTSEELAALASGDIVRIESWVGKLDSRHARWLMNRLCQERW